MIKIHKNFIGGNIRVIEMTDNEVFLENELRDTEVIGFIGHFALREQKIKK